MRQPSDLALLLSVVLERPALAWRALRRLGRSGDLGEVWLRAVHRARDARPRPLTQTNLQLMDPPALALKARAKRAERDGPLVSVITPLRDTSPALLRAAIASVLDQPYRRLELILVDDSGRPNQALRQAMLAARQDGRVRVVAGRAHGGPSAATNAGLAIARGEFTAFLEHEDELTPDALTVVAERLLADPKLDVAYTDQFTIDAGGEIIDHQIKPDWSPLHGLGVMYVGHLLVTRTPLAKAVGGCDPTLDGVQAFDLVLRLHEAGAKIGHIRAPLYKSRDKPCSASEDPAATAEFAALQLRAVAAHLQRLGRSWAVESHPRHGDRRRLLVAPSAKTPAPAVSLVIPLRNEDDAASRCLASIRGVTRHAAYEIIVVDDANTNAEAQSACDRFGVRRVEGRWPLNFSATCNLGTQAARGGLVLFLHNSTEIRDADWLHRLSLWFEDASVGVVGAVLTCPEGRVRHAGVVLDAHGPTDHAMRGLDAADGDHAGRLCTAREVSAVTGACMMMRRAQFAALGGFCTDYSTHYQDVDLCLRLRARGLSVVCTPQPIVIHQEVPTGGCADDHGDRALFVDRWRRKLAKPDPYSPHRFNLESLNGAVAI